MRYLVATDSVHTTAAACDYLEPRLTDEDSVTVVTAAGGRDADDALNVARARLVGAGSVELDRLDDSGEAAEAVLAVAEERDADELLIGAHAGTPDAGPSLGDTARRIIEAADRPVVVVPLSS